MGIFPPKNFKGGMADFYANAVETLRPGMNSIITHTTYDDAEMQAITINHPDYATTWRQADLDFFTSERCKKILEE